MKKSNQQGYLERFNNHCFDFKCFRLRYHFIGKNWGSLPFSVIQIWGHLPFFHKLRLSSISKELRSSPIFQKCKKSRLSSISKKYEIVFHFQNNWSSFPFKIIWVRLLFFTFLLLFIFPFILLINFYWDLNQYL